MTRFAIATRDELWLDGRLVEQRLSHGEAIGDEREIAATDARDEALVAACDAELARLRLHVMPWARVRLVAEATTAGVHGTMTVTLGGLSIVTTPEHIGDDLSLLRSCAQRRHEAAGPTRDARSSLLPIVWRHGSAAVLLHEAVGHAREHGHEDVAWPEWLSIDSPLAMRRASFRDVPLLRMTTLVARQHEAPFALPEERIEVLLVEGGSYEPLTHEVALRIGAADLIEGDERVPLAPFDFVRSRSEIASSVAGAYGDPVRYPGVVCSREGQELVVESWAPVLVTG